MPLGEAIGELVLRPILELVLYGLSYWTGFLLLKVVTFGAIRLAPLTSIEERNRSKRKWNQLDWSIWLHRPMQGRALKAECTCLVGILLWVAVGFGIYVVTRDDEQTVNRPPRQTAARSLVSAAMPDHLSCHSRSLVIGQRSAGP